MSKELVTLAKILGRLGSSFDEEKLAAALAAVAQARSLGSWFHLLGIDQQGNPIRANTARKQDTGKFTEEEAVQIYNAARDDGYREGMEDASTIYINNRKTVTPKIPTVAMLEFCQKNEQYLTDFDRETMTTFDAWSIRRPGPFQLRELILMYSRLKATIRMAQKMEATTRKKQRRRA